MTVRVFAPAKINLSLHVGKPLPNGRHPIESVVAFADVGDVVWAEEGERPSLALAGPYGRALAGERDNLVLRAAQLLAAGAGKTSGVKLTLEKNVPIASGIGGGSSDAAATLKALNQLWALGLSDADLENIAREIGADVPACVGARACYMTGTGEDIVPIEIPPLHGVLVNPNIPAPTGAVYKKFDERGLGGAFARTPPPFWREREEALAGLASLRNDLTAPAIEIAPPIAEIASVIETAGGARLARLSGSGATMFALTDDAVSAAALAAKIESARPNWWVKAARLN